MYACCQRVQPRSSNTAGINSAVLSISIEPDKQLGANAGKIRLMSGRFVDKMKTSSRLALRGQPKVEQVFGSGQRQKKGQTQANSDWTESTENDSAWLSSLKVKRDVLKHRLQYELQAKVFQFLKAQGFMFISQAGFKLQMRVFPYHRWTI